MDPIPPRVLPGKDQRKQGMGNGKENDEMEIEGGEVEGEHRSAGPFLMDLFLRRSCTGQTMPREGAKEMLPSVPEFSLRKISVTAPDFAA